MSREKTLIKNTILYMVANFASKLLGFILLPFYTYYLSTGDYGYFDLITTTVMMLIPVISMQVNEGAYRYLLDAKNNMESNRIISNTIMIAFRNTVVFFIAAIIFIQFTSFDYSYLIVIQVITAMFAGMWQQMARGLRNNAVYSVSGVIYTAVMLASNLLLIIEFDMRVDALIYSNIAASVSAIAYIEWKLNLFGLFESNLLNGRLREQLVKYSLPLLPNAINWWAMSFSSRYFINFYMGTGYNGLFAVANKFPAILLVINSIFSLAWQESAITEYSSGDRNEFYTRMFNIYMKLQFTTLLILLPVTKWAMGIMADQKFFSAWRYVPFLYLGVIFSAFSTFYGTGYLSSKETKGAFSTSITGAFLNIAICAVFLPVIGLQAASLASTGSFLAVWLLRAVQTRRYFRIKIEAANLSILAALTVFYICVYFLENSVLNMGLTVIAFLIFYIVNKPLLGKCFGFLKAKTINGMSAKS